MRAIIFLFFTLVSIPFSVGAAFGATKDPYDLPQPVAIQARKYQIDQSLFVSAGYLPTDSFNKGYGFGGGYRYSITPYLTWEVVNFIQVMNKETQLKQDLQKLNLQVQNVGLGGKLDYPKQIVSTSFQYSPFYSKSLMFNSILTYSESMLALGVGAVNFNAVGSKPMLAPGIASRIYLSPSTALNLHFRDYFYQDDNTGVTGIIDFGIGFEFGFHLFSGGSSRGDS